MLARKASVNIKITKKLINEFYMSSIKGIIRVSVVVIVWFVLIQSFFYTNYFAEQ